MMTAQQWLWSAVGASLALVIISGIAEWRRNRRPDIDAAGWAPWRGFQVSGFFVALVFTILALKV